MALSRSKKLVIFGAVMLGLVTAILIWWLDRELDCRRMMQPPHWADEKIVRDASGKCYACRDDGWLYDIAYPTCPPPQG